jgi:transcriptional regulator with XRE-family HTH domain
MPQPKPLSPEEKQQIRDLHAEGLSRNEIARRVGRSNGSVTNYCKNEGLTFPPGTASVMAESAALTVKQRTLAAHARQLEILELLQTQFIAGMRGTAWKTKLKGAGGSEKVTTLDFVPSTDKRDEQSAIASAASSLKNLAPTDDTGRDAAISVVEALARSLGLPPEAPE